MPISLPGVPFKLTQEDMGRTDLASAIAKGLKLPFAGQMEKATADYKQAMANYLLSPGGQGRGLSSLGKELNERAYFNTHESIGGDKQTTDTSTPSASGSSQTESDGKSRVKKYDLKTMKDTTDPKTRERNLYATNIEKTFNNINPDDLFQYSGLQGGIKKYMDQGRSLSGNTPEEFAKYSASLQAAKLLAKQIRQYFGTSIQPEMDRQLNELTDPSSFFTAPDVAKIKFSHFKKILNSEMKTLRDAVQTTDVYTGQDSEKQPEDPNQGQQQYDFSKMSDDELRKILGGQ